MSKNHVDQLSTPAAVVEAPWLKTPQACHYLGISVPTLRRWVRDGRLKPRRTPTGEFRFKTADLDAILA